MDTDIPHSVEARLVRIEEKIGLPPPGEEEESEETEEEDEEEETTF